MMSSHPGTIAVVLSGAGAGNGRLRHNKSGIVWRIHQICVKITSTSLNPASTVVSPVKITTLFNSFPVLTPVVVADGGSTNGVPPLDIGDHDEIVFQLTKGSPGANVTLTYFYEEIAAN